MTILALALTAGAAGCKNDSEAIPDTGTGYYPIAVGNTWTYAVTDSTWSEAQASGNTLATPSVLTVSNYQFKETITDVFTDASGQPAYRLVRSKMGPSTTSFRDDSVFVLTANANFVALNRNNAKTVELIFPVRQGRSWNLNAFNNIDTVFSAETRQYSRVGLPFTTGGTSGFPSKAYEPTITVNNTGTVAENSALRRRGYQQVFGKGIGPVFRRRFFFANFYINNTITGRVDYYNGNYLAATSRRETLIDYHLH